MLLIVTVAWLAGAVRAEAQQRNGEAYSTTPEVIRELYDMHTAMAPLSLGETELKGRALYAQRCANCHGGTRQRPGPLLGKQTVAKLGETAFREKVRLGSPMMPGFQYALQAAQIDYIFAFLRTFTPRAAPSTSE